LKSLVFATVGVALGIMAGTIFADGSWRSFVPGMSHQPVLASSAAARRTSPPGSPSDSQASSKAAKPNPTQQSTDRSVASELLASAQAGAVQAAPEAKLSSAQKTEVARLERSAIPSAHSWPPRPALQASNTNRVHRPVYTDYDQDYGPDLRGSGRRGARLASARPTPQDRIMAARSRRAHLRKLHFKRRMHAHPRAVAYRYVAPAPVEPAPTGPPDRFSFTVEGSVTVTNYDPAEGRIQTYEGETFVLDKSNADSSVSGWTDYPADLHYTCNESWNCTLVHGGVEVVSARRTR
jgi:hypothetical protein